MNRSTISTPGSEPATVTGLASTREVIASVGKSGAQDINDQLVELALKFRDAARLIDPTITGTWFGHDVDASKSGGRLYYVFLERANRPFVSKKGAA